jgi:hypothetical protein
MVKSQHWLLVCTLLLALFLALTKRQQELQNNGTESGRTVLNLHSASFLNQVITIVTAATLTGYSYIRLPRIPRN